MSLVDDIRNDLVEYAGLEDDSPTDLDVAMQRIVSEHGAEAMLDEDRFRVLMGECGVSELDIRKALLLAKVDGFGELVTNSGFCAQADLDRFASNAELQSGLNRYEIIRFLRAFSLAAGIAYEYGESSPPSDSLVRERAFVVPESLYNNELKSFGNSLGKAVYNGSPLLELDFKPIEPLVEMGIPLAKHYMGYCLLHGSDDASTQNTGITLLSEAAAAGNTQAMAELGDYYYCLGTGSWTQAYECYTGLGALALSSERQTNILTILNRKSANSKTLILSAGMLALMLLAALFGFGASIVLGILFSLASAAVLALGFMHFRKSPYDDVYVFPVAIFVLWTISMAISSLI